MSLIACLTNDLAVLWQMLLVALVIANFLYSIWQSPAYDLIIYSDRGWQLGKDKQLVNINILPSTVINPWLICLHFNVQTHHQTLLIMRDSLSVEDYRQLVMQLKITASQSDV